MRRCLVAGLVGLAVLGTGCETLSGIVGKINLSVESVTPYVEKAAASGVKSGLKALSKDTASYETTKRVAGEVETLITDSVLPLFSGAEIGAVTKATADQAMAALNGANIEPQILGAIQLAVDSALLFIKMPENPTDALSDDTKGLIVALFNGITKGLQKFQSWGGPDGGARDLADPVLECSWQAGGVKP